MDTLKNEINISIDATNVFIQTAKKVYPIFKINQNATMDIELNGAVLKFQTEKMTAKDALKFLIESANVGLNKIDAAIPSFRSYFQQMNGLKAIAPLIAFGVGMYLTARDSISNNKKSSI